MKNELLCSRVIITFLLYVILLTHLSSAGIINAESISQEDVQIAIDSANPNDTVIVPAGTDTWIPYINGFQGRKTAICMRSWRNGYICDALFIEDNFFIDNNNLPSTYTNERIGTLDGGKLVILYQILLWLLSSNLLFLKK